MRGLAPPDASRIRPRATTIGIHDDWYLLGRLEALAEHWEVFSDRLEAEGHQLQPLKCSVFIVRRARAQPAHAADEDPDEEMAATAKEEEPKSEPPHSPTRQQLPVEVPSSPVEAKARPGTLKATMERAQRALPSLRVDRSRSPAAVAVKTPADSGARGSGGSCA